MQMTRHRDSTSFMTIRTLVMIWAGSIFLVWAILVSGWLIAKVRLTHLGDQVVSDTRALDTARLLELAILTHRREDLLWEVTGEDYHKQRSQEEMQTVEHVAADLNPGATTPAERELVGRIQKMLAGLRERSLAEVPAEMEMQSTDDLLALVEQFQQIEKAQMDASHRAADQLREDVGRTAVILGLGTAVLLIVGSFSIINRVVRPALGLTNAARAFGGGNLSERATVLHNDEMGMLAQTFNNMADDIATRDERRLQFIALVAHDLKNPVLAIEMATRVLRESIDREHERGPLLDAIAEEARRLRRIVRDLTDDIQVASGRLSVRKAPLELAGLVQELVRAERNAFSSHEIAVETEGCVVLGDANRIERVVANLVSNAVKYSPCKTPITIRVQKTDTSALLSVSDQGPGITKEDLNVLFQPFGRGRSAGAVAEGSGIGLYVVKQIVEAHGGRIEVQSEPGEGTIFRVTLPLAQGQSAGEPSIRIGNAPSGPSAPSRRVDSPMPG
jgi:two-component system sensor histidine kinase MtrB